MVKRLGELGLVTHRPYHGVRLTEAGPKVALEVIRHHRLLELYLVESLGVPWDRVHQEAEVLEHVLSEELEELIAAKLGDPTHDPHGDPIPSRELEIEEISTESLESLAPGACGVFARVSDSDPDMLRYLSRARHRPRGRLRGGGAPAVRRAAVRAVRDRGAPAGRGSGPRDPRAGEPMSPDPAFETAGAEGRAGTAAVAEGPTPLERLLARGRLRVTLSMLGPAFVAAVAYVDPGNFATNLQGGARFGYELLWVVLLANLMAMLIQYLSAKLGIATGNNLPELCRERFPRWGSRALWVQAEVMAMATDVAEFLGAAIGLNLLFGVPLLVAGGITGVIAFGILELQRHGFRRFELAIAALLGIVFAGFVYETFKIGPSAPMALRGFIPHLGGSDALYVAVGIVGATVMPHVIYLHSALTQGRVPMRNDRERRQVLRFERLDVAIALTLAGVVNLAMLAVFAKLFHTPALSGIATIQAAHHQIGRLVGGGASLAFAVALLASGASSSSVGTFAGQVVMSGFIGVRVPLLLRRAVTMLPALVILGLNVSATDALVLSQVVLSFGIPFALIPLVVLTGRRDVMGAQVNGRVLSLAAYTVAALITAMNVFLIGQQFLG